MGQKRKLLQDEGGGSAWESQLQSVLDISMDKFHRDQALVEPCLLRSVLINNTLRQVQSEIRAQVESLSAVKIPSKLKPESDFQQLPPPVEHNASLVSPNAAHTEDDIMAWTSEEDFSLSSAILKDLDAVIDAGQGPCASQRSPLSSVENLTQYPLRTERTSDIASSVKTEVMCPGCPRDVGLDALLLDIDTSVFEPEVNLLPGFSITADELVKYLPSSSSSLVSHSQATWEIQELEHVMDVLMRTYPQS